MMVRLALALLALLCPPAGFFASSRRDWTAIGVSIVWVIGLAVFLGLFAGPGLLLIGATGVVAAALTAMRRTTQDAT